MSKYQTQYVKADSIDIPVYERWVVALHKQPQKKIVGSLFYHFYFLLKIEFWGLLGCGFLIGRASIMKQIYPLGQAFLCSLLSAAVKRKYGFFVIPFILLGTYLTHGLTVTAEQGAILLFIFWFFRPSVLKRRSWYKCTYLFAILLILRLAVLLFLKHSFYYLIFVTIETTLAFLLTLVYTRGIEAVLRTDKNIIQSLKQDEFFSLLFLTVCILSGTAGLSVGGFSLQSFLAALIILVCSFVAGGGAGAAAGVSIAMVWGLTGILNISINQWGLYGFCGLLGGIFREHGKSGTILGYLLGTFILVSQMKGIEKIIYFFAENLSAMGVFALISKKALRRFSRQVPGTQENIQEIEYQQKKLKNIIAKRLTDLAQIFSRLSQSFEVEPEGRDEPVSDEIYNMVNNMLQKVCENCRSYEVCWGEYFYLTYREVFDLMVVAEVAGEVQMSDLHGRLSQNCFQQNRIVNAINGIVQNQWHRRLWKQKLIESRKLVSGQLSGVVQLMQSLAKEVNLNLEYHHELEHAIWHGMASMGVGLADVSVMSTQEQQVLIGLEFPACSGKEKCSAEIVPKVSEIVGKKFSICQQRCGFKKNTGFCEIWCSPVPRFKVDYHVAKAAKTGNVLSGDSHGMVMLKEGKCAVMLSDGMGTGPRAALESSTAVNLLEQLLESGLDRKFAVRMVNNILLLRSAEEIFATVDLAIIDLFQGEMEMLKIGAAPSYLKRQKEIYRIESDSLPAGILSVVTIEPQTVPLQEGDTIVMITDGVLEAVTEIPSEEDWLMKVLKRIDIGEPETLATFILSMAKEHYGGEPRDDLSILVIKVQKNLN